MAPLFKNQRKIVPSSEVATLATLPAGIVEAELVNAEDVPAPFWKWGTRLASGSSSQMALLKVPEVEVGRVAAAPS